MKPNFGPSEPKPFALVPIPSEAPKRDRATSHERFTGLTGQLELTFAVVSEYLFVGSGDHDFDPNAKSDRPDVWHTFYRRNGQVCVPATSMKGAIRSIVEAISNSCVLLSRMHEVRLTKLDEAHFPCRYTESLCPACRLFGITGLRGRVWFSDALPLGTVQPVIVKIPELWHHQPDKIRRLDRARRFYEQTTFQHPSTLKPELKHWFIEAVSKGVRFQTVLQFENLSKAELGLLLCALGLEPKDDGYAHAFTLKLGGAKPRCFGAVKFEPQRVRLWQGGDWQAWLKPQVMEGAELVYFVRECLNACQNDGHLLHKPSWRAFISGMKPKTGPCPRGVY